MFNVNNTIWSKKMKAKKNYDFNQMIIYAKKMISGH